MIQNLFLCRLEKFWEHPLSPIPFVAVCTGFWLPVSFIHESNKLFAIQTTAGRLHVMATSVIWTAVLSVLVVMLAYVAAGFLMAISRTAFQKAVHVTMSFALNLAILIPCLQLLQFPSLLGPAWWNQAVLLSVVALGALLMTYYNLHLAKYLILPVLLTPILIIISFPFVAKEAVETFHSLRRSEIPRASTGSYRHPDIILITIDTLSASHLHTYGYHRPTSPSLDAFSADSIIFDNFYANANWTLPGVASILNGVRPWTHNGDIELPSPALTEQLDLPILLNAAGYEVDVVQSNSWADFGVQGVELPANRKFLDCCYRLFHWLPVERLPSAASARDFGLPSVIDRAENSLFRRPDGKSLGYLPASLELLRQASWRRPLFFWIHVMTPHAPYAASPPFLGTFDNSSDARSSSTSYAYQAFARHIDQRRQELLKARYDEAILQTDNLVGRFIGLLQQQGRFEHSVIIVTADHGESFLPTYGEHGGPLLSEELIHVPCLIKPPAPFASKHESKLMEQADLLPTILTYAGLPLPSGIEGLPYQYKTASFPIFSMNRDLRNGEHTLNVAMRDGDWKYVIHLGPWKHPWPQQELYNLASDPDEKANLISSQPERAAAMRQRVLAEVQKHGIFLSEYQH